MKIIYEPKGSKTGGARCLLVSTRANRCRTYQHHIFTGYGVLAEIKTNCVPSLITFGATKIFLRRNIQTGSGSNAPPSAGRGE